MNSNKFSNKKENDIIKRYLKGENTVEIAKSYNTYNTSIRRVLERYCIPLRTNGEDARLVKTNPFENLENPEVQYWLGYIITDGCVYSKTNTLSLNTNKDPDMLSKYVEFLKYPVPIRQSYNKKYDCNEYAVAFNNPEVKAFLISLGITPQKSKTLDLKTPITSHMLRGILDGDGYVKYKTDASIVVSICSASETFVHQIKDYLTSMGIEKVYTRGTSENRKSTLYYLEIYHFNSITKFYNLIYDQATVCLERKRLKFGPLALKDTRDNSLNSVENLAYSTPS